MIKRLNLSIIVFLILFSVLFPKQITFNEANTIAQNWTKILEEKFSDQVRIEDGHSYTFRTNDPDSYTYSVGVVDKNGAVSDIPEFINLTLDN